MRPPKWRDRAFLAVAALGLLLGMACMAYFPVGVFNDDAMFVNQARQFLRTGDLLHKAGDPGGRLMTNPPGHSILLVPIAGMAGGGTRPMQWFSLLLTAGSAWLLGRLALRRVPTPHAVLVSAAFLLSPVVLTYGSTVQSDVSFTFFSLAVLALADVPSSKGWSAYGLGLLAGFSALIRVAGLALVAAATLVGVVRGGFSQGCRTLLGAALLLLPYYVCVAAEGSPQVSIVKSRLGEPDALARHFKTWSTGLPTEIGTLFTGQDSGGMVLGLVLLVLAAGGFIRLVRRDRRDVLLLFLPWYVAIYLLWPFVDPRYLLPVWGIILLLVGVCLPGRAGLVLLALLVASYTPAVVRDIQTSGERGRLESGRWASYQWLKEHAGPQDAIMTFYENRTVMLTDRPAILPPPTRTCCETLAAACRADAPWLIVDPILQSAVDTTGRPLGEAPSRLDLWLDASTLVQKPCRTLWDRVYRVTVPRRLMLAAFRHYARAGELDWGRQAEEVEHELRRSLDLVADFPEARGALAAFLLQQPGDRRAEAVRLLEGVVSQYPHDFPSAYNLGLAYYQGGDRDRARELVTAAHLKAIDLGAASDAQNLAGLLAQMR